MGVDYTRARHKPGSLPTFRTLDDLPHRLTPQQLAEYLGIGVELVYEGLRGGWLPGVYLSDKRILILRGMVETWEGAVGRATGEAAVRRVARDGGPVTAHEALAILERVVSGGEA
jgi:hypothetical protein